MTSEVINAKRSPFAKIDVTGLLTWTVDLLTSVLISLALTLCLFEILALNVKINHVLLVVLVSMAALVVFTRKWWILPAAFAVLIFVGIALFFKGEVFEETLKYLAGFADWVIAGMPAKDPYTYNASLFAVEAMCALPVCAAAYAYTRKMFSFIALFVISAVVSYALYYYAMTAFEPVLLLLTAAAILSLPRVMNRRANKGLAKDKQISRVSMQIIAVPVALASIFMALYVVPENEGAWRSETLNTIMSDISDFYDYYFGDGAEGYNGGGFSIGRSGYLPLKTRLGGDLKLDNNQVMRVDTEVPTYLAGSVQDTYDGMNWFDGWHNGKFRYGSIFWRSKRIEAFSLNLPLGGRAANELYEKMTAAASYDITPKVKWLNTFMTAGNLSGFRFPNSDTGSSLYFNIQGELFRSDGSAITGKYTVQGSFLDRSLPEFDENMRKLELLMEGVNDKYLNEHHGRYTFLYDTLPESVREFAREITRGIESDYDKAIAIEKWLAENCTYTLTPGMPPEETDFVAYFLETREGYCTYYATAMAVLGRCVGLPTRYVTGYGLRQVSDYGRDKLAYEALNSSAHAWCEVYFAGIGWIVFDPLVWDYSPIYVEPVRPDPISSNLSGSAIDSLLEDEEEELEEDTFLWDGYRLERQEESAAAKISEILFAALGVLALAALGFALIRFERNRYFRNYTLKKVTGKFDDTAKQSDFYYEDILKQLSFWGVRVSPGETVEMFSEKADRYVRLGFHKMKDIGETVSRCRYGLLPPRLEDIRKMQFYHEAVETYLRETLGEFSYFIQRIVLRDAR